jgi:FAD/FMN-containing dehydrogenase
VIGSEGMLAVVFEVTVKLLPLAETARCIMASFDDVRRAGDAVAAIIAAGIVPAGLEMMDKPMTAAVESFVHAGYDLDAAAILLCESDGSAAAVEHETLRMAEVLRACGATRIEASENEAQRLRFWSGRKNAFPASGRISPDYMCMDSTIPRKRLADMLIAIAEMETRHALRCVNVFHAGDGNLHPLILFDANDADQLHRAEAFGAEILELSVADGRHRDRRARRRRREAVVDVRPVLARRARPDGRRQARLRSGRQPQSRQGDPDALALRRVRANARPARPARVSRAAALLNGRAVNPAIEAVIERVRDAHASGRPLRIRAGGTKDFYGETPSGEMLDVRALVGAADHEPTELVVTAPAGMTLVDLEALLAEKGQCLAFEPPRFGAASTVGGMVAAGLSGPSRAAAGSVRDHLLGVTLVSGTGELMHFGGRVIKNVAGYDVSRLIAGSLGILGVIVEVSLKVMARAPAEATLRFDCKPKEALALLHGWGRQAAAPRRQRVVERQPDRSPARRARRRRGRSARARRRGDCGRCRGAVLAEPARPDRSVLRRRRRGDPAPGRDALAPVAAADGAPPRPRRRRADRMARRAALARHRVVRAAGARRGGCRPAATRPRFARATNRPASSRR